MVTDQRLTLQLRKNAAVIADNHAMTFLRMLEGEEQPFLLKHTQHEIQVRFLILRTVADRFERLAQAEFVVGQGQVVIEDFLDDLLGGLVLEDARITATAENPDPRHELCAVVSNAPIGTGMHEVRNMRTEVSGAPIGQRDAYSYLLANEFLELDPSILGDEFCLEAEQFRNRLAAAEAKQLKLLFGRQR
ncbi:hypothetical protein D3C81_740500 [compost metagenome]